MSKFNNTRRSTRYYEAADNGIAGSFFLPNLCAIRPLFILVIISELVAVVLSLYRFPDDPFPWYTLALTSLLLQWITLTCAVLLCSLRRLLGRFPLFIGAGISYAIIILVVAFYSIIAVFIIAGLDESSKDWSLVYRNTAIGAIVGGMVLRYFYVQQQWINKEQAELQARIQALQSRIRPHFLFNSMNSIASLISTDPQTAEIIIEDLADLFRASLSDLNNQVPIQDELELCQRYIRIEQLRLGSRLKVKWKIKELPPQIRIPLLTLQPLLENAIYHGIQPSPTGGTVHVVILYDDGVVKIQVSNPVSASNPKREQGNRMALSNIRGRLTALYGVEAQLITEKRENRYIAKIRYPYVLE